MNTNKFYIQQFAIGLKERSQILETFGSANVSFFGSSAKIYNFGGTALDWGSQGSRSYEFYHASSLMQLYENVCKGSLLVKEGRIAVLRLMNHTVFGYPLVLNVQYDQSLDKMATFSMGMLVTKHLLSLPGLVTETELAGLYDATKVKPLTPEAETMVANIELVSSACLACLNLSEGEHYNPDNPSIFSLGLKEVRACHEANLFKGNLTSLADTLKEYLELGDGQVSPFIASKFGHEPELIEQFIDAILFQLDALVEPTYNYTNLQAFRQQLERIKNFVESLQSLKLAITT